MNRHSLLFPKHSRIRYLFALFAPLRATNQGLILCHIDKQPGVMSQRGNCTDQSSGGGRSSHQGAERQPYPPELLVPSANPLIIWPDAITIRHVASLAIEESSDVAGQVRMLATDSAVKKALDELSAALYLASACELGTVDLRSEARAEPQRQRHPAMVFSDVGVAVRAKSTSFRVDSNEPSTYVRGQCEGRFETAEPVDTSRTPTFRSLDNEARTRIGDEFADELASALAIVGPLGRTKDEFGPAELLICIGARTESLLLDVGRVGEYSHVVSKATVSRAKLRMEDCNLITTIKEPAGIGRPRLRLTLPDGTERTPPVEEHLANIRQQLSEDTR